MSTTLKELQAVLRTVTPAVCHGDNAALDAAADEVTAMIDSPQTYAAVAGYFAQLGAVALKTQRQMLPEYARAAMFALEPFGDDVPLHQRAAGQIITARANDDLEMLFALIKPYAFLDPHDADAAGDMLAALVSQSRHLHQHVCGGHR